MSSPTRTFWDHFMDVQHNHITWVCLGGFCQTYPEGEARSEEVCNKSLATMFAHFVQETGTHNSNTYLEGLYYLNEINGDQLDYEADDCQFNGCSADKTIPGRYVNPCEPGKKYYGSLLTFALYQSAERSFGNRKNCLFIFKDHTYLTADFFYEHFLHV